MGPTPRCTWAELGKFEKETQSWELDGVRILEEVEGGLGDQYYLAILCVCVKLSKNSL